MKQTITSFIGLLILLSYSCQQQQSDENDTKHEALNALFDKEWNFRLAEYPFLATSCGVKPFNDQLPDVSVNAQEERAKFWEEILEELKVINRASLSKKDRINYDVFQYQLEDAIAQVHFESYLLPFNSEGGFLTDFYYMTKSMPFEEKKDFESYLFRLQSYNKYVNQHIELMRLGIKKGMTQPRVIMQQYPKILKGMEVDKVEDHSYYQPFLEQPDYMSSTDWTSIKERATTILLDTIQPSLQRFAKFMETEYVPACRESIGASELPNGDAYYEQRIAYFTTTKYSAEEIFNIGQQEVARIRKRMESIIDALDFDGDFAAFLHFLRTDRQFYASSPEELLKEAAYLAKKIDGKLPKYFNLLPRLPYGVSKVPDAIAPTYTTGRYSEGSLANHKSGTYWVNTYQLESRPLYSLPALTLHEAVPGHHLQISLAQELEGIPPFRQNTYLSCYGEGWGLYAEYLGEEAGMYETLYTQFGRLTYEMWRACRLVVDVGLHAKGWSREEAVEFMASNTALSLHNVSTEIDRYIGWPGQALSYKMGELKIIELRKKVENALGENFDIRAFHDVILSQGAVPLFVLEEMVDDYIGQQ